MPIYTKQGDRGNTKTFRGAMSKSDDLAEALGAIDELNSWIGVVVSNYLIVDNKLLVRQLKNIQTNLMKINAMLAGATSDGLRVRSYEIKKLEKWIDKMTSELPELTNFIYPVGEIQVVRAVCRRAERAVVKFVNHSYSNVLKYLNRLSDYLFTLARWVNFKNKIKEEVWRV